MARRVRKIIPLTLHFNQFASDIARDVQSFSEGPALRDETWQLLGCCEK